MRWIFFTLLMSNLAYLAVNLVPGLADGNNESALHRNLPAATDVRVNRIMLLSETGQNDRMKELEQVLSNPVVVDEMAITETSQASEAELRDDQAELPAPVLSADLSTEQQDASDPIALLAAESEPEVVPEPLVCSGLGPFDDVVEAQNYAERFNALGAAVNLKAIDRRIADSDYRVVIPPLKSVQEAFRRLRELKSQDIDSYVITQGPDAQGISLGVFSSEGAALRHQANLASMSYATQVNEIPRVSRGYWLIEPGSQFDPGVLSEIFEQFNNISVDESVCLN